MSPEGAAQASAAVGRMCDPLRGNLLESIR
jgi:hypothetical protein